MHPECPRLVAGGRHHPPVGGPAAAHDDGLSAQLGAIPLFDRSEERVQVDVEDGPSRAAPGHAMNWPVSNPRRRIVRNMIDPASQASWSLLSSIIASRTKTGNTTIR